MPPETLDKRRASFPVHPLTRHLIVPRHTAPPFSVIARLRESIRFDPCIGIRFEISRQQADLSIALLPGGQFKVLLASDRQNGNNQGRSV